MASFKQSFRRMQSHHGGGRVEKAISTIPRLLEAAKEHHGDDHHEVGHVMLACAKVHETAGNSSQAEQMVISALVVAAKSSGEDSVVYAVRQGQLGLLYKDRGAYALAEPLLIQAAEKTCSA
jgi:hypothetical protein